MTSPNDLLLAVLRDPARMTAFSPDQWNRLLRYARLTKLVAKLGYLAQEHSLLDSLPGKARDHFTAAQAIATQHQRIVRWEVNRVCRALVGVDADVVLLKGAAYVAASLPPARGRLVSDVDIMVPKAIIGRVEQALIDHGWEHINLDPYDQRYYRTWMHELPPMRHIDRQAVMDVHHTILPETGRLHPDADALFDAAQPVEGLPVKVLCPTDMVLHSAAHLFQDGDLNNGLRDLTDLDDLLRHFATQPDFWDQLVPRAVRLDLQRPLFYALRYCHDLLNTPVPDGVLQAARVARPAGLALPLMDRLVTMAMSVSKAHQRPWVHAWARWTLYIRSHWLRMPPTLLAKHLTHKALKDWFAYSPGAK